MKFPSRATYTGLLTVLALHAAPALAIAPADPQNYCTWSSEGSPPLVFVQKLNTVHVPKDAPPGSVIGEFKGGFTLVEGGNRARLSCFSHYGPPNPMRFRFVAETPIVPTPLPPFEDGHVLKTNIEGIGARVVLSRPFNGGASNHFDPDQGHTMVPFTSSLNRPNGLGTVIEGLLFNDITLIKTGNIAPGAHAVDTLLFRSYQDYDNIGEVFSYRVTANVVQSQCQIIGDPVKPNPVDLGAWERSDFTGPPFTTRTEAFEIALTSCQTDPAGLTQVSIELDPANGSRAIDPDQGIFSLSDDADDDAGVGIQVVMEDGSPLPLNREVPLLSLTPGNMAQRFGAHFIQTAAQVKGGDAKGAVNFTLRYR
jgi:type 1 fimbria pilin